jgi:ketosteroid isomerase-like protein
MQTNAAHLFHLHDDKVTRLVFYWDRERTLTDLGMSSEANPSARGPTAL